MALLTLLADLRQHLQVQLVVAHCDHGMRPDSHDNATFVRRHVQHLGLPCCSVAARQLLRSEVRAGLAGRASSSSASSTHASMLAALSARVHNGGTKLTRACTMTPCRQRRETGGTSSWHCLRARQAAAASRSATPQLTAQRRCCCT